MVLQAATTEYGAVTKEFFTFTTPESVELRGWMTKPRDFDPAKKYPVLMVQYSGPNSNEVLDQWDGRAHLWHTLLADQGYIVACVDPRGTGHRGKDFRHVTYGELGKYETEDQIATAQWLASQSYVDGARIGIWGWSYGGYFTSYAMTHCKLFKAGIAGAPVTDWRNYDAIYTERYMDLPQVNLQGYKSSSSVEAASQLHGRLLIIHGERDDNVHVSNSLQLIEALQEAGRQFDMMIYPKNRHAIVDEEQRYHMYQLMTEFLQEHLMGR